VLFYLKSGVAIVLVSCRRSACDVQIWQSISIEVKESHSEESVLKIKCKKRCTTLEKKITTETEVMDGFGWRALSEILAIDCRNK